MHVFIPLRSPGEGKTRLATSFSVEQRARIAAAMLTDVVAAVRDAGVEPTVVASGAPAAAAATALGCDVLLDRSSAGLNQALLDATSTVPNDQDVLIVLADLPRLTGADVRQIINAVGQVVLAPNEDGGTSALLRRPHAILPTTFGPDSAAAHRDLAVRAHLELTEIRTPGLARDLDTMADVVAHDPGEVGPTLRRVLRDVLGQ